MTHLYRFLTGGSIAAGALALFTFGALMALGRSPLDELGSMVAPMCTVFVLGGVWALLLGSAE